jgi:hypothetical protein
MRRLNCCLAAATGEAMVIMGCSDSSLIAIIKNEWLRCDYESD